MHLITNVSGSLAIAITLNSSGVTGQTPYVDIQRVSDNNFLVSGSWGVPYGANLMNETDSTNRKGRYHYTWSPAIGLYRIHYKNTGTYYVDAYEDYQVYDVASQTTLITSSGDIAAVRARVG